MTEAVAWWRRALGPDVPVPLVEELERAQQHSTTPWAGVSLTKDPSWRRRRLVLPRARYVLFYEVNEAAGEVWVLRVWHMSRGETPQL